MNLLPEHLRANEHAKYIVAMAHRERKKQTARRHAAEYRVRKCEECLVRLRAELLVADRDYQDVEHSISILRALFVQAVNTDPQGGHMQSLDVSEQMPPVHPNPIA